MRIEDIYLSETNERVRGGRGRYERPGRCGYTNDLADAGRFPLEKIDRCREDGIPKYIPVRLIDAVPELATLQAENRELREALGELISIVDIHSEATDSNFAWAEVSCARALLAKEPTK